MSGLPPGASLSVDHIRLRCSSSPHLVTASGRLHHDACVFVGVLGAGAGRPPLQGGLSVGHGDASSLLTLTRPCNCRGGCLGEPMQVELYHPGCNTGMGVVDPVGGNVYNYSATLAGCPGESRRSLRWVRTLADAEPPSAGGR